MSDNSSNSLKDTLLGLGKLIAVIMIVRYGILIANHYANFVTSETFANILNYVGIYAPLALMTVVGLGAVWDKSDILKLVVAVVCAAVIIISFFPDVAQSITEWLQVEQIGNGDIATSAFVSNFII